MSDDELEKHLSFFPRNKEFLKDMVSKIKSGDIKPID
jgi:hypothetical protein